MTMMVFFITLDKNLNIFIKFYFFKNKRINLSIFRVVVYNKNVAHFILILEYFLNKNFHLYLFFFVLLVKQVKKCNFPPKKKD